MLLTLRVRNLAEPDRYDEITVEQEVITIGRDASNVLVLPDKVVSRRHAAIRCGLPLQVTDLGSNNATFLNDTRLRPEREYEVRFGDVVRVGNFAIEVVHDADAALSGVASEIEPVAASVQKDPGATLDLTPAEPQTTFPDSVSELRLLNELAVEIGASREVEAVIERIVQRSVQALGAEQGDVTLVKEDAAPAREKAPAAPAHTMIRTMADPGEAFHMSGLLLDWMQAKKEPLLLNDPHEHAFFGSAGWSQGVRSLLAVPLMVRSGLIGVLTLYNKKDRRGFTSADARLLAIIAAQSAQVIENARLIEEERRYAAVKQELRVALDIQLNLLPREPPAFAGYDIAGRSLPAEVVGGDYFDFISIDEGRLAVCVGDVAGKGLPAALVMSNLQATLRAQTYWSSSVEECLAGANDLLHRSTNRRTFVTLFYGVIEAAAHRFRYANAGHNRPLFFRPGYAPTILNGGGLALGLRPGSCYPEQEIAFAPGDVLVVYSDGVTEAVDERQEQFEMERLAAIIARHHREPSETLMERILEAVQQHAGKTSQADDVTVLVVKRLDPPRWAA